MTEIFCVQNILFLKPQHIHFDKNTCIIKWIIIVSFWKMPRIVCTLLATTGKIIITMLLRMTPRHDLMKYLWVSCYFECHLLSYHSGSQVVPGKKVDYCNTLVLNITYHYCQYLTLFPYPLLIIFHLSNLRNLSYLCQSTMLSSLAKYWRP